MPLEIAAGYATEKGRRERNEDFVGIVTPNGPELSSKGLIAAIADGVSGNDGGREASEYTVRGLLADYYATPDTWSVTQALDRVIKATNSWVQNQGSVRPALAGMATTLTTIVLRGGFYHFAHVGDTRLYLLRKGVLSRMTSDHVWDRPEMHHVLTRAIGLDSRLAIDHGMGEMHERDVFLLTCDGVWASMTEYDLTHLLSEFALGSRDAEDTARALVDAALAAGSADNVSAIVLKVAQLPEESLRDVLATSRHLPVPAKLKPGQRIDGMTVDALMHASPTTILYRVTEEKSGRKLVLKTLQTERAADEHERSAFAHEEWLATRVVARFFPQVVTLEQKNWLYFLTTWHDGHTLQEHLDAGDHYTVPDVITHGIKLVRAIGALHRRSIIHRDIKPANVHLGTDHELRLLDLGVAQSGLD
ncbi:MAG: protein phosphatase 2C domain-containing protein [Herminiimonas sp.]|nr:protein phosphatase 2C domain-containing protein [Herminiimonas sp.]